MENQSISPCWLHCVVFLVCFALSGCDSSSDPAGPIAPENEWNAANVSGATATPPTEPESEAAADDVTAPADNSDTPDETDATESPDQAGSTSAMSSEAFLRAAYDGRTQEVERALDGGMDIEAAQPGLGHTALHMAAYNGHTGTVLLLIKRGAKIDSRDAEGKTPLTHACTGPYAETVEVLIKAGADVNVKDSNEGFTPLMMAAGLDQLEIVKILLANKADKDAVDTDNDKAIDHARRENLAEIVELLN